MKQCMQIITACMHDVKMKSPLAGEADRGAVFQHPPGSAGAYLGRAVQGALRFRPHPFGARPCGAALRCGFRADP